MNELKINILLIKEDKLWVAIDMDHDIAAQGETVEAAKIALEYTIIGQIAVDREYNIEPFQNCKEPPEFIKNLYESIKKGSLYRTARIDSLVIKNLYDRIIKE